MVREYTNGTGAEAAYGGDPHEREARIVKYAYLVKHIAVRMARRLPSSVSVDELASAGSLGLIDAVDKFDVKRDVSLKTYAQYRIKGAILDELRSMDWYSRSMRKKIQDIEGAVRAVEAEKGGPAEDLEIADRLGVPLEKYQKMLTDIHGAALLNLDAYIRNSDNDSLSKRTFQENLRSADDPVSSVARMELKGALVKAVKSLSEKEQLVVSLYYYEELTLKEIGEVLGLTESRICQIHSTSMIKLRSRFKSYYDA